MHPFWSKKEWYVLVDGFEEGPYSISDLKVHPRVNPETPVRKENEKAWRAIKTVPELRGYFQDSNDQEEEKPAKADEIEPGLTPSDELTISIPEDPSPFWLWVVVILSILLYVILQKN